jgi:hypothetical protein
MSLSRAWRHLPYLPALLVGLISWHHMLEMQARMERAEGIVWRLKIGQPKADWIKYADLQWFTKSNALGFRDDLENTRSGNKTWQPLFPPHPLEMSYVLNQQALSNCSSSYRVYLTNQMHKYPRLPTLPVPHSTTNTAHQIITTVHM